MIVQKWEVIFADEFTPEFRLLPMAVQIEFLAHAKWIEHDGPRATRPRVNTLKGSVHSNMKEPRFEAADGVWRFAFAFDPKRRAIILVAGDKSGVSESRFYKRFISKADDRFKRHLAQPKQEAAERETGNENTG